MPHARANARLSSWNHVMIAAFMCVSLWILTGCDQANSTRHILITSQAIIQENALPGTTAWKLDSGADTAEIAAYTDQTSYDAGQTIDVYASAIHAGVTYTIALYRLGWYSGDGARLYYTSPELQAQQQGYWTPQTNTVQACPTCTFDTTTHLLEPNWAVSAKIPTQSAWLSGVYLVKLTSTSGAETYAPVVIRNDSRAALMLATIPINTYQAYNLWGGYSLYNGYNPATGQYDFADRARKVTFNRPITRSAGTGDLFAWDIDSIRWLERNGLDVSYVTNVDLAATPGVALQHRVFIALGHDEYWTKSMRDGLEAARDQSVNLAFFGSDDGQWQARLEADATGNPNRVLVCYKVATGDTANPLTADPEYLKDPKQTTTQWRDPAVNRPENSLLGIMHAGLFTDLNNPPDWVVPDGKLNTFEQQAGMGAGEHISGGLLGYEYDAIFNNGQTPAGLQVLGASPVVNASGQTQTGYTTYYRAKSGALVFDAGSFWWGWGLDSLAAPGAWMHNSLQGNADIQRLTLVLLTAMVQGG